MPNKRYSPSKSIRKRISDWEGRSMYAPAPDTGKVNRSFEAEAADFLRVTPQEVIDSLPPEALDAVFSTSYNIGAGNYKKRVVPNLVRLVNGEGTVEDVTNSMYGTNDKKYRGLRTRRATERQLFSDAYNAMLADMMTEAEANGSFRREVPTNYLQANADVFTPKAPVVAVGQDNNQVADVVVDSNRVRVTPLQFIQNDYTEPQQVNRTYFLDRYNQNYNDMFTPVEYDGKRYRRRLDSNGTYSL